MTFGLTIVLSTTKATGAIKLAATDKLVTTATKIQRMVVGMTPVGISHPSKKHKALVAEERYGVFDALVGEASPSWHFVSDDAQTVSYESIGSG